MSKFSDKEFILLNRAKDLYIYTSEAVGNEKVIPRRRRYPTGQRLETMAMEILQKCHLANTTDLHRAFEERQRLQTEVIALCLTLEQLIDALKASKAYPGINLSRKRRSSRAFSPGAPMQNTATRTSLSAKCGNGWIASINNQ